MFIKHFITVLPNIVIYGQCAITLYPDILTSSWMRLLVRSKNKPYINVERSGSSVGCDILPGQRELCAVDRMELGVGNAAWSYSSCRCANIWTANSNSAVAVELTLSSVFELDIRGVAVTNSNSCPETITWFCTATIGHKLLWMCSLMYVALSTVAFFEPSKYK